MVMPSPLQKQLPNYLTMARLLFSLIFFIALSFYRYPDTNPGLLDLALALFIIAAVTDWLDGALARRWKTTSAFGRIMDPVCDKVLVIGAFVFLAGPMFTIPEAQPLTDQLLTSHPATTPRMISGVYPWMVVLILGRELLVTAIRGYMESEGIAFGASWSGKAKMILQSIVIPILLLIVAHFDPLNHSGIRVLQTVLVYLTLTVTVVSGLPYIRRAMHHQDAMPSS